jgi:hypothetical protein
MDGEAPLLIPRRIRERVARAVAALREEIAAELDRTRCAVPGPEHVVTAEEGRAWIEAVVAALPVRTEGGP